MKSRKWNFRKFAGLCVWGAMLLVLSCDSTPRLQNRWIGRSKQELVAEWGQPAEIQKNPDGSEIYTYIKRYYPDYQGPPMHPIDPPAAGVLGQDQDYPIQITAETSKAAFWISPQGKIYKARGRIME